MKPALPSNRSFGFTFTGIFVIAGTYGFWQSGSTLRWLLVLAALTALVTMTREAWLTPLNRGWMKFGELLGRVVSPVVLGIIFFGVFTPVALVMRVLGRDALARSWNPAARTYWLKREPPGPPEGSFRDMF
jgi:hypothetical protein